MNEFFRRTFLLRPDESCLRPSNGSEFDRRNGGLFILSSFLNEPVPTDDLADLAVGGGSWVLCHFQDLTGWPPIPCTKTILRYASVRDEARASTRGEAERVDSLNDWVNGLVGLV